MHAAAIHVGAGFLPHRQRFLVVAEFDADLLKDQVGIRLDQRQALLVEHLVVLELAADEGKSATGRLPARVARLASAPPPRRRRPPCSASLFRVGNRHAHSPLWPTPRGLRPPFSSKRTKTPAKPRARKRRPVTRGEYARDAPKRPEPRSPAQRFQAFRRASARSRSGPPTCAASGRVASRRRSGNSARRTGRRSKARF